MVDGYDGYIIYKLWFIFFFILIFGNVLIFEFKRSFLFVKIEMLVYMVLKIVVFLVWLVGIIINRGIDDV